jgi:cyclic pyranopterin phosphate synthase
MIADRYGPPEPVPDPANPRAPAERFRLRDGTQFGIIASVTAPFCRSCDRSRVTADGSWYTCLYSEEGLDLREPLRMGVEDAALADLIRERWAGRSDRGAEARLSVADRGTLVSLEGLRADPRREMHTRGG